VNVYDKNRDRKQKEKMRKSKKIINKYPSKIWFRNGSHNLLRPADARGSDDIIYRT